MSPPVLHAAMSRCGLHLLLLLVCGLISVTAASTEQQQCNGHGVQQGCTVQNSHAECASWDLAASIHGLPACVTKITFSLLAEPQYRNNSGFIAIRLQDVNFSNLTRLQELSIEASRRDIDHVRLAVMSRRSLETLKHVRILRLKVTQDSFSALTSNKEMYEQLKYLRVLDLTRASKLGMACVSHTIGTEPSMETLILKNVQERARATYVHAVDLASFICKGNVRHLDLSYNDLVTLRLSADCWNTKLRYINLRHNVMSSIVLDDPGSMTVLPPFSALETFDAFIPACGDYQAGLWEDEEVLDSVEDNSDNNHVNLSPLSKLMQNTPFAAFASYDFWFTDVLKHCGDIGYVDLMRCAAQGHEDLCAFLHCIAPEEIQIQECPKVSPKGQLQFFASKTCTYTSCYGNMLIPLPPKLRLVSLHNVGQSADYYNYLPDLNISLCFHPHNSLEVVDLSNFIMPPVLSYPENDRSKVTGLHKLRYLNVQGSKLPFSRCQIVLLDAGSLEELHIGGSVVASDNVLPEGMLSTYTKLSLLNLSDAQLVGIEAHAFRNLHELSVLDLSYNSLRSSALLDLDFSQTRLKSLNMSHNELTHIPASMREQLDGMEGLELYLSGNNFLCTCDNLGFLQWIQGGHSAITLYYAGDHVCADSPGNTIHNIDVDSLHCNWYWMQPVIAVTSSLALSLLFIGLFILYKKRWFVSNLLFRMQERLCVSSNGGNDTLYKFDAFILYSSVDDDRTWVHFKLVQELENVYGVRLCVHHRDFLAGCDITENIKKAILSSRKVVVVMSENFLRSDWCIEEVQMTRAVDRKKLIVVMYKDVPLTGAPIPPVIQLVLESTTYIQWHETPDQAQKLFWKQLRRALFSKRRRALTAVPSDQHALII